MDEIIKLFYFILCTLKTKHSYFSDHEIFLLNCISYKKVPFFVSLKKIHLYYFKQVCTKLKMYLLTKWRDKNSYSNYYRCQVYMIVWEIVHEANGKSVKNIRMPITRTCTHVPLNTQHYKSPYRLTIQHLSTSRRQLYVIDL